jgi:hypothetical protein
MMRTSNRSFLRAGIILTGVGIAQFLAALSFAQFVIKLDDKMIGTWVQSGSSRKIEFQKDGAVSITFTGEEAALGGKVVVTCVYGGGSFCIHSPSLGDCTLTSTFSQDGMMSLNVTAGNDLCRKLNGDFRRVS